MHFPSCVHLKVIFFNCTSTARINSSPCTLTPPQSDKQLLVRHTYQSNKLTTDVFKICCKNSFISFHQNAIRSGTSPMLSHFTHWVNIKPGARHRCDKLCQEKLTKRFQVGLSNHHHLNVCKLILALQYGQFVKYQRREKQKLKWTEKQKF